MQQSFVVLQVCRHLSSNHLSFACPRASLLTLLSFVVNGENICYARIQTSRAVSSKCALCQNTQKKMPNSSQVRMIKLSVSHIKRMTILANIEGLFFANGGHNCYARIHSSLLFSPCEICKKMSHHFFQLVWVPITTTHPIWVCFLSFQKTLFS